MKTNTERDVKKSIDRLSTLSSEVSSKTFNTIDKVARTSSNYIENRTIEAEKSKVEEEVKSRLKTSENAQKTENNQDDTNEELENKNISKLKTNINETNINETNNNQSNSDGVSSDDTTPRKSKLKTVVDKTSQKVFKFNDNQGKVSKVATAVSKSGEKVSKVGKTIVKTSRELNKAMSEDGSGTDYINEKITRKIKTKASNKARKTTKKVAGKVGKKFSQTIGKKLLQVAKSVILKLIKILISMFVALAEFIIPIALVVILLVMLGSIFGASSSESTLDSYKKYMNSIQEEYDKQVDDFMEENPDGIVFGVDGNYGRIDWRIPLSILQGTDTELTLDQSEKDLIQKFKEAGLLEKHLIQKFKEAGLLEKHEVLEQIVEKTDDEGNTTEETIKVLVITNSMYEDYLDWCKDNYSYIANYHKKKGKTDGSETYFSQDEIDILEMLYQSDAFADLLGNDFKTKTPSYGSTTTKANLNSEYYNSKNVLVTSGYKGQCTWYSHGRALELFNVVLPSGNAQTWLNSAVSMGLETGTQPSYNSVVVLSSKKYGHVAFVEAYDGKTITISEGNVGNPCSKDDSCSQVEYANQHANELVRTKTYSSFDEYRRINKNNGYTIIGFIYLD